MEKEKIKFIKESQKKYKGRIKEFTNKEPLKECIIKHSLTPIKTDNNPYVYNFIDMNITSYFEPAGGFFELTTDEVLSIME